MPLIRSATVALVTAAVLLVPLSAHAAVPGAAGEPQRAAGAAARSCITAKVVGRLLPLTCPLRSAAQGARAAQV